MNRAFIAAAVASLLIPAMAAAQQNQNHRPEPAGGHGRPPQGHTNRPPAPRPHPTGRPVAGGPAAYHRPVTVQPLPPRGNQYWHRGRYYGRVHGPAFVYPRGWHYRQWLIGQRLPPMLFAPAYFYPGWAALGLQAPVPGYAWVRFGPDLLLVNQTTGEVEDVAYGVFY